jgi:acyl-CoA-dependent ceramide synthase
MYNSEFWLNLHGVWDGWPFREVDGIFKCYYLLQWAFYVQQILVVNIEEKRKDYTQMLVHHIFTTALLFLSYGYYHMRVGLVIMCTMDLVDIILPVSPWTEGSRTRPDKNRPQNCLNIWATPPPATLLLVSS